MPHARHERRLAVQEPIVGVALVTAATTVIGAVAWLLASLVGLLF